MRNVIRGNAVVVEEPPAALVTDDAVVCCPANDRLKQFALEAEGTIRIIAYSKAEQVAVAC